MSSSVKLEKNNAHILVHLNENGIGSSPDLFFCGCEKCGLETRLAPMLGQNLILKLIYFWNSDFKGLSMVATVPDHQSNKTCWG